MSRPMKFVVNLLGLCDVGQARGGRGHENQRYPQAGR